MLMCRHSNPLAFAQASRRTAHHANLLLPSVNELNQRISVGGISPVGKLQLRGASS